MELINRMNTISPQEPGTRCKDTLVFIQLDAFRWNYINPIDTPLLYDLSQSGIHAQKSITTAGFTQRSAIFTGTYPDVTGNFTMFCYNPQNSPFRFLRRYLLFLSFVQSFINTGLKGSGRLNNKLRNELIYPRTKQYASHAPTAAIPLHILPLISVTEDENVIYEQGSMPVGSIFDVLHEQGVAFEYLMFPVTNCEDDNVLETALQRINKSLRFYLLLFSDSDSLCHSYGPESLMRRKVTGEIDRKLRVLKEAFESRFDLVRWFIISDHGMTDVKRTIDVARIIHSNAKRCRLKHGKDYLLFLDSTMARLYALTGKAENFVKSFFHISEMEKAGKIITEEITIKYRIPLSDKRYGDIIWWANPGVLIYPNYFQAKGQYKGMHGYDPYFEDMKGFAIIYWDGIKPQMIPEIKLIDICPTLSELLKVNCPKQSEGTAFCTT